MAERKESSVLFSLRELRQIEDDRVESEKAEVLRREEEVRQARLAEERAKREAEERARRDVEEAERMRLQNEELRLREEQIRLEETERRHRVEAQARLEEQRLKMEIEAKTRLAERRKPWALIISSAVLFILVAGLGVFLYVQKQRNDRAQAEAKAQNDKLQREAAKLKEDMDKQLAEIARTDEENRQLVDQLKVSQDAEQQKKIRAQIEANQAQRRAQADELERLRQADIARRKSAVKVTCKDKSDPLCGM